MSDSPNSWKDLIRWKSFFGLVLLCLLTGSGLLIASWCGLYAKLGIISAVALIGFSGYLIINWESNKLMFKNWATSLRGFYIQMRHWRRLRLDSGYRKYHEITSRYAGAIRAIDLLLAQEEWFEFQKTSAESGLRKMLSQRLLNKRRTSRLKAAEQAARVVLEYREEQFRLIAEAYCGFRYDCRPRRAQHVTDVNDVARALLQTQELLRQDHQVIYRFNRQMEELIGREIDRARKEN
jgi:hypothetical protein